MSSVGSRLDGIESVSVVTMNLLSRDEFREAVFARDNHRCVICGGPGQDAHHIVERRLFDDGGYYVDNGATVCDVHHIQAEQTLITCEQLREAAGITRLVLPEHLYLDERWDKWGNNILPDGRRLQGELFHDESVQKILAPVLSQFTKYVKYPRTYHLPWSTCKSKDDRQLRDVTNFEGQEVVVTMKMDGENTSMYNDHIHARSLDSMDHVSQHWVKNFHSRLAWLIPDGWRVCGENLFAKHSIKYNHLPTYFMVFSVWIDGNNCLSWHDTVEWCELLDIEMVPVLYRGPWDEKLIRDLHQSVVNGDEQEGYVVRTTKRFHYSQFRKCVAKFVRPDHVQTHGHWRNMVVERNGLQ